MATLKQIEANRRNSLKSTGPRTVEGKAVTRLNSLRQGRRAFLAVLPGENLQEFRQVYTGFEQEYQPQNRIEQACVEELAVCYWRLYRLQVAETDLLRQQVITHDQLPLVERIWRGESRIFDSFIRVQRRLHRIQAQRRLGFGAAPPSPASPPVEPDREERPEVDLLQLKTPTGWRH